ncbi:hypothetical protein ACFXDI_51470 [Streptomyces mirabilis]|uniref:hypothetical protein n=1 Tax=Streptomyces mirabilis TaxID=68239 RepID=UPI003681D0D3
MIPAPVRERLAIATAEYNNCTYCLSAHTYIGARVAKVDAQGTGACPPRGVRRPAGRRTAGPVRRHCPRSRPHRRDAAQDCPGRGRHRRRDRRGLRGRT